MAKLEMKHISTYLPYNVWMQYKQNEQGIKYAITNLTDRFYSIPTAILDNFILYLKPLTELEKDTTFIKMIDEELFCGAWKFEKQEMVDVLTILTTELQRINLTQNNEIAEECPFIFYKYLVENHYDIYGLIEKGLAKNILELKTKNLNKAQK